MINIFITLLSMLWIGVLWRGRGGAFATMTGWNIGDTKARLICGFGIGLNAWLLTLIHGTLAAHCGTWLLPCWLMIPGVTLAIWLGDAIACWAQFQRMGQVGHWVDRPSWEASLLKSTPLTLDGLAYDVVGMSWAGLGCLTPAAAVLMVWCGGQAVLLALTGLAFGPVYLLFSHFVILPKWGQFADGRSWSEVFVGTLAIAPGLIAVWF